MPGEGVQRRDSARGRSKPEPPASDRLYRRFVEESSDLLTVVDVDGRFVFVNPGGARLLGREVEELIGRSALEVVHPEDRERTRAALAEWIADPEAGPFTHENRQLSANGKAIEVLWSIHPELDAAGKLVGFASIARDVTQLKRKESALRRSEAAHRAVLRGMLDCVVTVDAKGIVQDASESLFDLFGYRPDELAGRNISILMPEPYRSEHDGYLERYLDTGETWILGTTREFQVVRKNGERLYCELSVSRIDLPDSEDFLLCGSFRDITGRRQAERALAESEQRFRAIFDQEFQYVGLLEPDGTILETNRAALSATNLTREEAIGRPFWETPWWSGAPETRQRVRSAVRQAAKGEFVRFEADFNASDGGTRTIDFSLKPIFDPEGRVRLLIPEGRDITEIKRAQQRETSILRALAAVGESASVLAHEIKNPITAINLSLRAVSDKIGEDHAEVLGDLVARMKRLELLIRRTLSFARPIELTLADCDPGEIAEGVASTLQSHFDDTGIRLETEVAPGLPSVRADAELVESVLMNLLRNALEAGSEGGTVRLSVTAERGLSFLVDDDGPGIPLDQREEVFRPFVTGREEGSGMGLALARRIAEEHGGTLVAEDSPLGGARMRLTLP